MLTQFVMLVLFLAWSAGMVAAGYVLCYWGRPAVIAHIQKMMSEAKKQKERDEAMAALLAAQKPAAPTPPTNQGN